MKTRTLCFAFAAAGLLVASGYGLYRTGLADGKERAASASDANPEQGVTEAASGRKVLYWHDPMVPGPRFDKPGKSPFMDMQLVPVYADPEADGNTVSISPRIQQNLGMRSAEVALASVTQTIEATGSVAFNDAEVAVVQSNSNGVVEKLHVHAQFDTVRKDQPLAEVRLIQSNGAGHRRATLLAPRAGVVTELGLREGQAVMAGATLFRINGMATVWINAEVPENVAAQVLTGGSASIRVSALPGRTFSGYVNANLPDIATATRTRKVRIEIANADGKLVPGMSATINFESALKNKLLLVPTEALIRTGTRDVVIVSEGDGHFRPQEVTVGTEAGEQTEILSGLVAGERVVTSGQFLIDSEASMKGVMSRASTGGKP